MQDENLLVKDCKQLLENILSEAPKDNNLILAIIAKADKAGIIHPESTSLFPNFYGYVMDRTKMYLMSDLKTISNVPREGEEVRIMTAHYLVYWDKIINGYKGKSLPDKLNEVAQATYAWTKNTSPYKNAEIILVFRDKAQGFINANKTQSDIADEKRNFYENWLKGQTKYFTDRLWNVVKWLHATQELEGRDTFVIPLELFKRKKVNHEEAKKLIINLENRKIVSTFKELGRTPPTDDPNKPTGSIGESVKDKEEFFYDPKTTITLTHEFKYLYGVLEKTYEKTPEMTPQVESSRVVGIQTPLSSSLTPKQTVRGILDYLKFPKKQRKLLLCLGDGKPKDTKTLKKDVDTGDLSTLKRNTLDTIKKHGLSAVLKIESYKDGFKYFYRLDIKQTT
ncbi:MAG TPA: hypothetical protein VMR41_05220 [Patescibacteria group bacterium]|nr:hypothetical protein [Patescibacteria group bacterium]